MTALLTALLSNGKFDLTVIAVVAALFMLGHYYHKGEQACEARQITQTSALVATIQEKKNEVTTHDADTDALIKRLRRGTF